MVGRMRVAITGTNRGIGLEFTRQLLERGDVVEAAAREPSEELLRLHDRFGDRLRLHRCEVTDGASVAAFGQAVCHGPLDLLINNAGVLGEWESLEKMDLGDLLRTVDINAVGPLRVTRAMLPALRSARGKVAHLSSRMGSIGDNGSGGAYAYRMSKVALNMAARSMAIDLRPEGIRVVTLHPGWVQTAMGGPEAPTPVDESVRGLLRVIDGLSFEQSGHFLDSNGAEVPW
jgi:NAD(P)-dependent dehydrogenase (short-subunit alcohol dehydrogenase family)